MRLESGRLRLFPLNTVLFPGTSLGLNVFEPRYKQMISECIDRGDPFGIILIRDGDEAGDPSVVPYDIGTTAEIGEVTPLQQGRFFVNTIGRRRFRIEHVVSRDPYLVAEVTYLGEDPSDAAVARGLVGEIGDVFAEYMRLLMDFSGVPVVAEVPEDPVEASFLIADALQVADSMKQQLLELSSTEQRLTVELGFLRRLLPQLRSLLERKRREPKEERRAQPDGASRASQEKFFGKHFSVN
jgi:Lon protease-like protein